MRAFIGMTFLSLGVSFLTIFFFKQDLFDTNLEAKIIEKVWHDDINKLQKAGNLPDSWQQIKTVKLQALSPRAAKWLNHMKKPIRYNSEGKYLLEVNMDHNEEDASIAVITHYNLVDIASGNTLWEFGRTYIIANKKWIDKGQDFLDLVKNFSPDQKEDLSVLPLPPRAPAADRNEIQN